MACLDLSGKTFLSFYNKGANRPPPLALPLFQQQRAEKKTEKKRKFNSPRSHRARRSKSFFFFSSSLSPPPPTQSPANNKRCAPHKTAEPSGEGGNEFQTLSNASQIAILITNGNGVDQSRSGIEWAYQE